jgi:hypothetical protein
MTPHLSYDQDERIWYVIQNGLVVFKSIDVSRALYAKLKLEAGEAIDAI